MFGYVRPRRSELKIKEFDYYKTVYCGLCHAEKKLARRLRYTLSYDMVTLALARIGACGEKACFEKRRCAVHPAKGCLCTVNSPSLAYTASCAAILVYYKLLDDIHDERGLRRFSARMMLGGAKRAMKVSPIPTLNEAVREKLDRLHALEEAGSESVYDGADLFGALLAELFSYGDELTREKKLCLSEIGLRLGRFIYIVDAYADMGDDKKAGKYNPFLLTGESAASEEFAADLVNALDIELSAAEKALDLLSLEDKGIENILRNIITMGLRDVAYRVIIQKEKPKAPKEGLHE